MAGKRSSNDSDRYVQPNKERGGWDVVKEGHKQASAHTETKADAIDRARQIVRDQAGDETVGERDTGRMTNYLQRALKRRPGGRRRAAAASRGGPNNYLRTALRRMAWRRRPQRQ